MLRFKRLLAGGAAALAIVVGCTSSSQSGASGDGTAEVQSSQASALVAGTLESTIDGDVRLRVNERAREIVQIAPDRTFLVREVPAGRLTLAMDVVMVDITITGSVIIEDVQPAEVIRVSVRREGDAIVIVIVARSPSSSPAREVATPDGSPLVISGNNVLFMLRPIVYTRDIIISGNHVALVGEGSCVGGDRTILTGALTISGDDAIVFDVDLQGPVTITGNNARVQNTCGTECFSNACFPAGSSGSGGGVIGGGGNDAGGGAGGGSGNDAGGSGNNDAGGSGNDAGTSDAGTSDGGTSDGATGP